LLWYDLCSFRAFEKLNNFEYEGSQLSVSWALTCSNLYASGGEWAVAVE